MSKTQRLKEGKGAENWFYNFLKNEYLLNIKKHPNGEYKEDFWLFLDGKKIILEVEKSNYWKDDSEFPDPFVYFFKRRKIRKNCFQVVLNTSFTRMMIYSHDIIKNYDIKTKWNNLEKEHFDVYEIPTTQVHYFVLSPIKKFDIDKFLGIMNPKGTKNMKKDYAKNLSLPLRKVRKTSRLETKGYELISEHAVVAVNVTNGTNIGQEILINYPSVSKKIKRGNQFYNQKGNTAGDNYINEKYGIKAFDDIRQDKYCIMSKGKKKDNGPARSSEIFAWAKEAMEYHPNDFNNQVKHVESELMNRISELGVNLNSQTTTGSLNTTDVKNLDNSINKIREFYALVEKLANERGIPNSQIEGHISIGKRMEEIYNEAKNMV